MLFENKFIKTELVNWKDIVPLQNDNFKETSKADHEAMLRSFQKNTNYCGRDLSGGLGDTDGFKNPGDVSDFWDINTKPNSAKHYAMFNSDLIDKPIVSGCPKGGIICDPFCGTGTTLFRAYELNRNFIGNDGKKEYVNDANKLWQEIKSQERMFK